MKSIEYYKVGELRAILKKNGIKFHPTTISKKNIQVTSKIELYEMVLEIEDDNKEPKSSEISVGSHTSYDSMTEEEKYSEMFTTKRFTTSDRSNNSESFGTYYI